MAKFQHDTVIKLPPGLFSRKFLDRYKIGLWDATGLCHKLKGIV